MTPGKSMTTLRREQTGKVVSAKNKNTIVVLIDRKEKHPLLGKYITKSTKIHAHDAGDVCAVGDIVTIRESRPHSKMKSWEFAKIVEKVRAQ
jgi:small subunit ribosomal protein S17